ncbi:MAG: MurR/RpiR family transcriptional regulator [Anaerolineales bacterium]|nr:MurR/RpiR family transcriptional regulator [Anaerolineales bacterium]
MTEEQSTKNKSTKRVVLADRIVSALPDLSRKQTRIAHFFLDNMDFVAFASAKDVGDRTHSSAATVVRACQALGYEGYPDFQIEIRDEMALQRTAVERMEDRLANSFQDKDILARVFATDLYNIQRTMELTINSRLPEAAAEIKNARRILVLGDGVATGPAEFFTHSLKVMGLPAQNLVGGGEHLALALAFLQPKDLLVGMGFWRNLRDVVQAIQLAHDLGATTIGITDSKLSPLARLPDYSFLVVSDGVAHNLSPVGMVSLLNVFLGILSREMSEQLVESLRLVDSVYRRSGLLVE